jgi:3-deoxy-7-phosphoheptulonate synthase/chorismate mutase
MSAEKRKKSPPGKTSRPSGSRPAPSESLEALRKEVSGLNVELLDLLNRRALAVQHIGEIKKEQGLVTYDPVRESQMLESLLKKNRGPFPDTVITPHFKEIFKASARHIDDLARVVAKTSRSYRKRDTVVRVDDLSIGGKNPPVIMAGPCSVESFEQLDRVARRLKSLGVRVLRGGAFKPRTSPYSFQGLKERGLEILQRVTAKHGLISVTEVLDPRDVGLVADHSHILQVGTRNMFNYELLKELGRCDKPLLIKRGFMATLEEFLQAAEYIYHRGNKRIILCERGIRTFERWTRNTLDISAVPILKMESHLPVVVDVSHSTGRKDIVVPVSRAALAAGADGLMVEVHHQPRVALSDSGQQLDLPQFSKLMAALGPQLSGDGPPRGKARG